LEATPVRGERLEVREPVSVVACCVRVPQGKRREIASSVAALLCLDQMIARVADRMCLSAGISIAL
jgi:hypothetical protein